MELSEIGQYGDLWGSVNSDIGLIAATLSGLTLLFQFAFSFKQAEKEEEQSVESHMFQCIQILTVVKNSQSFKALRDDFLEEYDYYAKKEKNGSYLSTNDFFAEINQFWDKFFSNSTKPDEQLVYINWLKNQNITDIKLAIALYTYNSIYTRHRDQLSSYFRVLYRTLDFIVKSEIQLEKKWKYIALFRAQLSDPELFYIFYNTIGPHGENLISLIESTALLNNLPQNYICNEDHRARLNDQAYNSNLARQKLKKTSFKFISFVNNIKKT